MRGRGSDGDLSVEIAAALAARLTAYAGACGRPVGDVVADAVREYLDRHPDHERLRAAGLAAMQEYQAEFGPFTARQNADAEARIDRLFRRDGEGPEDLRAEGRAGRRDV